MTAAALPEPLQLRPFQEEGVRFLENRGRALLGDQPGLGKTAQLLSAARGKTLVVAPAMVLDGGVWAEEEALWSHEIDPGVEISHLSYHQLARSEEAVRRAKFNTVICDESHYLKNPKTQWTDTMIALAPKIERLYLATGTPIPNWSYELWTTLRMLYPGDKRFSSRWRWIEGWFAVNEESHPVKGKLQSHKAIGGLLETQTWEHFREWNEFDSWLLRRLRKNHLTELPPVTEQYVKVAMTKPQKLFYDRLKEDYVAWVAETGTEVSAWSDGGLHTKLAQVQTGVATVDPEFENQPLAAIMASGGKYRMTQELLRDREGSPTVLFCYFRRTARILKRIAEDLGRSTGVLIGGGGSREQVARERRQTVGQFKAGETEVLVGTIETISEGLTLTAADTGIFVERSWKPYKNEQARFRIDRMGQRRPVNIIHLVTQGGIDSRMIRVLQEKTDQQVATLTAGDFGGLL